MFGQKEQTLFLDHTAFLSFNELHSVNPASVESEN